MHHRAYGVNHIARRQAITLVSLASPVWQPAEQADSRALGRPRDGLPVHPAAPSKKNSRQLTMAVNGQRG